MNPHARAMLLVALWVSGCASVKPGACLITEKPRAHKPPIAWHLIDVTLRAPFQACLSCAKQRGPANPSSFYEPRELDPDQVRVGPTQPSHEAQPPYVITRIKDEGKSPGFVVTDGKGDRYLFKLDRAGYPELLTASEVVASKLMYALGYHVPSYEIVDVRLQELSLDPGLGEDEDELEELVEDHLLQGRLRISASRWLDGEVLGPFSFRQHRGCSELRALKLAYAWINNTDAKDHNTLMVWQGNRVIGHLIDFGTSLGASASDGAKKPCQGWRYDFDVKDGLLELLALGMRNSGCNPKETVMSPAVGLFSPRLDPRRWKPYAPNLAFAVMTEADGRWMASEIAKLSRAHLAAAVAAGRYRHQADADRILEILEARRAAIIEAYLPETTIR